MIENYSCEIYGNGKKVAIKHNLNGGTMATVMDNLQLVSYSMEMPSRDIDMLPCLGSNRLLYVKPPGIVTINMEFKMSETDLKYISAEDGDIDIMFKQETEKLLTQAYKQIKARTKK